ncbi:3-ketoacyl-ACP reductase [Pseudoglutamicibacter cumminsii]|uniref:3-ketoacyl-ACP reductase n=1 Tax=Pseudoglutamicibacter cumminsii TaxID=156979 RepID=UPI0021A67825|nr:3-ketoacyl-ACP reductase [Pseudoglutamicibacter cumminsii]MCT1686738.1 3-ketoacyl-ACP reductase [Pseudoglutamicibacter cumminsii]
MGTTIKPVAVVTGGKQGLGLGAAKGLADRGFDIAILDLAEAGPETDACLEELRAKGASAGYYQLDISEVDRHEEVVDQIWRDFGRIDCLHNNAGIAARPLTDILDLTPEAFDKAVDINLRGTFFLSQVVANRMIADDTRLSDGIYRSIIFVSSIAAELVSPDRSQYNITKAGLSMLAKVLAYRLGPEGVAVHEVRPGFMKTAMTASAGSPEIEAAIAEGRVPLSRWGTAEDIGTVVGTLASGDLPYMTGQPLWIAGGLNVVKAT